MNIIGDRFVLSPDEGFPDLERQLPRAGTITEQRSSKDGNRDWFVFHFDEPFDYQKELDNPRRWKLISVTKVLVRSRWLDCPIGGERTAVFILVPPTDDVLNEQVIEVKAFYFDGWGMIDQETTD